MSAQASHGVDNLFGVPCSTARTNDESITFGEFCSIWSVVPQHTVWAYNLMRADVGEVLLATVLGQSLRHNNQSVALLPHLGDNCLEQFSTGKIKRD